MSLTSGPGSNITLVFAGPLRPTGPLHVANALRTASAPAWPKAAMKLWSIEY